MRVYSITFTERREDGTEHTCTQYYSNAKKAHEALPAWVEKERALGFVFQLPAYSTLLAHLGTTCRSSFSSTTLAGVSYVVTIRGHYVH